MGVLDVKCSMLSFQQILGGKLKTYLSLSVSIGGEVAEQVNSVPVCIVVVIVDAIV